MGVRVHNGQKSRERGVRLELVGLPHPVTAVSMTSPFLVIGPEGVNLTAQQFTTACARSSRIRGA